MRGDQDGFQDGFILVSALAVLAVLTALVVGAAVLARAAVADASLLREELTRDALIHAGLELGAYQTFALRRPLADMAGQRIRLDSGVVTLGVAAENGKVDLNGADVALLAGLWRRLDLGPLAAEAFADRVVDWRDPDFKRGRAGAERVDYEAAGRPGPANSAFETVDDVQHVLGVDLAAALALKPYLTVANPSGRVSALSAPVQVLMAVPKIDGATADRILALRRTGAATPQAVQALLAGKGATLSSARGPSFSIKVAVQTRREHPPKSFTVLRGDPARLYRVIAAEDPVGREVRDR